MASPQTNYDITLDDSLFVDPTFSTARKYSEFFPIKFKTIDSNKFMKLSASSRSLLVHMVGLSYTQGGPKIALSVLEVPPYRGVSVSSLISELSDFGYLQCSNIIEKKEIIEKKDTNPPNRKNAVALVEKTSINLISKDVLIPNTLLRSWADTYPKEYLEMELKKARSWLITNPHKNPKSNFGRFLNGWFDRGWDKYRQTLKANPTQITVEDLEAILKKDAE